MPGNSGPNPHLALSYGGSYAQLVSLSHESRNILCDERSVYALLCFALLCFALLSVRIRSTK